jgi:hypothetical protein
MHDFRDMKKIKKMNISKNRLGKVTINLPDSLEYLDISGNDIKSTSLLNVLPKLKTLVLNNNPILDVDNLSEFTALRVCNLWGYTSVNDIKKDIKLIKQKLTNILKKLDIENKSLDEEEKKSSYEKLISIYDLLLYNSDYKILKKTNTKYKENSRPSSILLRGEGDSSALSQLFHILLSMNDIESYTYDGISNFLGINESSTWNVINVGKKYYYSDITMAYKLGLEDYGHVFLLVSGKQFLATHPKGVFQQINALDDSIYANRNYPKGWASIKGNMYDYFDTGVTKSGLENNLTVLTKEKAMYVACDDKYVYYRNTEDNGKLYRINVDGTNKIKLNEDEPVYIFSDTKNLYYINGATDENGVRGTICSFSKEDGKKNVISENSNATWLALKGSYLYHKSIDKALLKKPMLYKMDKDGDDQEPIVEDILNTYDESESTFENLYRPDTYLNRDILFYSNASDNGMIYSVRITGKYRKKLTTESGKIIEVIDDYIYYKNGGDYFRIRLDGSEKTALKISLN